MSWGSYATRRLRPLRRRRCVRPIRETSKRVDHHLGIRRCTKRGCANVQVGISVPSKKEPLPRTSEASVERTTSKMKEEAMRLLSISNLIGFLFMMKLIISPSLGRDKHVAGCGWVRRYH